MRTSAGGYVDKDDNDDDDDNDDRDDNDDNEDDDDDDGDDANGVIEGSGDKRLVHIRKQIYVPHAPHAPHAPGQDKRQDRIGGRTGQGRGHEWTGDRTGDRIGGGGRDLEARSVAK